MAAPRFVVDENLVRLGRGMATVRHDVTLIGHPPFHAELPLGVLDTDWVPFVGSLGLIMITDNRRLRTRPAEAQLAISHELKVVHLFNAGHLAPWDQLLQLAARWRVIEGHIIAHPKGPWWLSARRTSLTAMSFDPGTKD